MEQPQTWHYGLVADWWALFNVGGPEIDYYGAFVARGQPALDAGCGAGRLLVPWLKAGYDVDGCDVSADMVERCRESTRREGLEPELFVQPLHALDPPRRYRTIVACGVFGLGSTRAQDEEALRRLHAALEPGGTLLLDSEVPYGNHLRWASWPRDTRGEFPEPWPEEGTRRTAEDGSTFELRTRAVALDPLDQSVVLELRVRSLATVRSSPWRSTRSRCAATSGTSSCSSSTAPASPTSSRVPTTLTSRRARTARRSSSLRDAPELLAFKPRPMKAGASTSGYEAETQ